jgi:mono/diheme cytochrome c family protein
MVLVAAGCGAVGRVGQGDPAHGKELFLKTTSNGSCASCHTLADAKSTGTLGPNLDDAFSSDKSQGFSQQTMADIVRGQIAYPEEPMPANLYRGQDARDIALYVAKCSGNPSCGVTAESSAQPTTTGTTSTTPASKPDGKAVFASAGCGGCHTLKAAPGANGTVGPDLDKLKQEAAQAKQPLAAFIKESIVKPDAYIAPGFSNAMPATFGSQIPADKLNQLVQYLEQSAK